jgi:putative addiction module CopG family antidote
MEVSPMPIELSPQTEALIRDKVEQGLYANANEAIAAAVRLLDEYDRRLTYLRQAISAGEPGEALPWTPELMDQLSREAEEMHHRGETPDPDVCP